MTASYHVLASSVGWDNDPTDPAAPEERVKLWLSMLEMVKADMKTGRSRDWGNCCDGRGGYAINISLLIDS